MTLVALQHAGNDGDADYDYQRACCLTEWRALPMAGTIDIRPLCSAVFSRAANVVPVSDIVSRN